MVTKKKKPKKLKGRHARNQPGLFYIPKKVNVLGHDYQVVIIDQDKFLTQDGRVGECEYPVRIIRISSDLMSNKEYAWLVFLHELRHAYQYECGDSQILQSQQIEKDADTFASFISSLKAQKVL